MINNFSDNKIEIRGHESNLSIFYVMFEAIETNNKLEIAREA